MSDDLWQHLYQRKLDKILNDAAAIAVSTAMVDRNARWALWDSFVGIASSILQIASFVVLPFVPFLGEMMMAYMAYQFLDEVFEGVIDWAEGLVTEAGEQLFAALESLVQLGVFGIGGSIGMAELPKVLPPGVVSFIDRFRPVTLRNGKTLYWKPDFTPYSSRVKPPAGSVPDSRGLHWHQGKKLLPIDQVHYEVSDHEDPGKLYIEHPTRTDTYRPIVRHNGEGAFHTELEYPLEWDTPTALERLGPGVESFSPAQREQILKVSGYGEDALRKMHVNQERVPALLADSLQRFRIDQQLQDFTTRIASNRPEDYLGADPLIQLQLLSEHGQWPATRRLCLTDGQGAIVWQSSVDERLPRTEIRQDRLTDNDLLKTLLLQLDNRQINQLLGEEFGLRLAIDVRTRTLRSRLAQIAKAQRSTLFEQRYQALQQRDDPHIQKVAAHAPLLPARVAEELLYTATGEELLEIGAGRWPAQQQELAEQASQALRINRAYEGLELDSPHNPDSDTLALHSLRQLPGWSADVRFDVRDRSRTGPLLDGTGPANASIHKTLVRLPDGFWQPYDEQGQALHAPTDFYTSVVQALPDTERRALNLQIGEGQKLKQTIRTSPLARSELRLAILPDTLKTPAIDTLRLRGTDGYPRSPLPPPGTQRTLQNRIRHVYPGISEVELVAMAQRLEHHPDGAITELSRLQLEYTQLESDLGQWMFNPPRINPADGSLLSDEQRMAAMRDRQLFARALRRCWRRESQEPQGHPMRFAQPILGDLPALRADFRHVDHLELTGSGGPGAVNAFLEKFPGLTALNLRDFDLHNLPSRLPTLPLLRQLTLQNCSIILTPENGSLLSSLNELVALDLKGNPLGTTFDFRAMPYLNHLNLSGTGISEIPPGLLDHPRLTSAWLTDNLITTLPDGLFERSADTTAGYDFFGNPLANATREKVKAYFNRTGSDMGVRPLQADIDRTKALFTDLNDRLASELIYRLPGSLTQGRLQLDRWESELTQLTTELARWARETPDREPSTGRLLTPNEHFDQFYAREIFAGRIERLWRHRSIASPLIRADVFSAQASFIGDMPELVTDFSHITTLSLNGSKQISATAPFLKSFPRLTQLAMHHFALDQLPQMLADLPALKTLLLKECSVIMTDELQAALTTLPELKSLELPNNLLGNAPDVSNLSQLTYLDLSHTGISNVPAGLPGHESLRTAIVSDNQISELPEAYFALPASQVDGFDFSGNPLNLATLEKIKVYSRDTNQDFGVLAKQADIEAIQTLFPGLDSEEASDVFYGLPGDLEHGRSQLRHWKAEIEQLTADLAQWKTSIAHVHPGNGQALSPQQLLAEHSARAAFADQLQALWRARSADNPRFRGDMLISNLWFSGELPTLAADFSHIREVSLKGNAAVGGINEFLRPFSALRHLELHGFNLGPNPLTSLRIPALERLIVENCGLTLTPDNQAILSSLGSLQYLNLSHNPLGVPPALGTLPALVHLRMVDSGISGLPEGLFGHPRLVVAIFERNQIRELPEILFDVPTRTPRQFSFTDNPLSPATRERIKLCYQQFRQDFGVRMPREDLDRIKELFPSLDIDDANRVLYFLPGNLAEGRLQIGRWETELRQLSDDLSAWATDIPERHPVNGVALTESERSSENAARTLFQANIEAFWRERSLERPESRPSSLGLNLTFIGELPALKADFAHVTTLSISGNTRLRAGSGFLQGFTGLDTLELRDLALAEIPRALARMPGLKQLVLSNCGVVLSEEGNATLAALTRMVRLDLYNNPLGRLPDIHDMPALEFIDLANTGISTIPPRLLDSPGVETAILSGNRITELPDRIFELPASVSSGYDFNDNPLNAADRDRIKDYYRRTAEDLGVLAEATDIARVQSLYPALSDEQASNFLYRLEGTLADGRVELTRREAELEKLRGDLASWEADVPEHLPTGRPLTAHERVLEENHRAAFREALLTCWRKAPLDDSIATDHDFTFSLPIQGELPTLGADFGHVKDLYLLGAGGHSIRLGYFLEAFPNLEMLDIQDYDLLRIPSAILRMRRLKILALPSCNITLTAADVAGLASLENLNLLHLHDNPLELTPDLSNLQGLNDLDLSVTGIREIPKGVLDNLNWIEMDLSGNEISEVPNELMELPAYVGDRYDLRGNPFSTRAMNLIRAYYQQTGHTLNVDGVATHPQVLTRPDVDMEI